MAKKDAQAPPKQANAAPAPRFQPPYYPIVYVRGYAMTPNEREEVFHDGYYGFAATSVEKRQAAAPTASGIPGSNRQVADIFEGQLIRFMKLGDYRYLDSVNEGLHAAPNPERSIWVSRFYDEDFISGQVRSIEQHAEELAELIMKVIPARLSAATGTVVLPSDYKIILLAHSMGGLVSRCMIQNILPQQYNTDARDMVHRFVTMATPHRGIDLGRVPDFLEQAIVQALNPFDAKIFQEKRMRHYLNLEQKDQNNNYQYDVHSLGASNFPIDRCLCIIGSDYQSYGSVSKVTGAYSDGLVRQDRAYVVAGPRPAAGQDYAPADRAFTANVHRAHSGNRGIVNSYESFENIQRFLFGDVKVDIALSNLQINTPPPADNKMEVFYDFEFKLSVRGSNAYLHQRSQIPCENALRMDRATITAMPELKLHSAFMNSQLARPNEPALHFLLAFRVVEFRVKDGFFFDTNYPESVIYSESLEVSVENANVLNKPTIVRTHWLSDGASQWDSVPNIGAGTDAQAIYEFDLRHSGSLAGKVILRASQW